MRRHAPTRRGARGSLSLIAYSTPQEAYEEIIPAFKKTDDGKDVGFKQSYGASGDQARAVEAGLNADVVALSLAPDVDKLVEAKKVAADWNKDEFDGFVTNSVVVLATRKGNPKNIKTWDDLLKDGVEVITAQPVHVGRREVEHHGRLRRAARGRQVRAGGQGVPAATCSSNVPVQDKSAREALQTFVGGKGDVLLAYENEAITAQQKGEEVDYVIPDGTILIQNPIAVDDRRERRGGQVRRVRARRRGPEDLRREGLPLGQRGPAWTSPSTRRRRTCSRSTTSAAGRR